MVRVDFPKFGHLLASCGQKLVQIVGERRRKTVSPFPFKSIELWFAQHRLDRPLDPVLTNDFERDSARF